MTLDEMVTQVAQRLNLTSTAALARIADDLKTRYSEVLGSIGMTPSSQGVVTAATVIGNRYVTFWGCQKILSVFNSDNQVLGQRMFDELRNTTPGSGSPDVYAVATVSDDSTTIFLNNTPAAVETLSADAVVDASVLVGGSSPAFPALYHDLLVQGAVADELLKMEKQSLAEEAERKFEKRLSELRYFLAKSAYLQQFQGKTGGWPGSSGWLGY